MNEETVNTCVICSLLLSNSITTQSPIQLDQIKICSKVLNIEEQRFEECLRIMSELVEVKDYKEYIEILEKEGKRIGNNEEEEGNSDNESSESEEEE